jgi:hypothetical protein
MNSIFIESFKRGLLDARPDETLDQARERFVRESEELEFDTSHEVSVNDSAPSPDFEALAARWRCSSRTVRRMYAEAGVDVEDPVAVGIYLASVRAPSEPMLDAVLDELSTN